jgi:hypothetical protein
MKTIVLNSNFKKILTIHLRHSYRFHIRYIYYTVRNKNTFSFLSVKINFENLFFLDNEYDIDVIKFSKL